MVNNHILSVLKAFFNFTSVGKLSFGISLLSVMLSKEIGFAYWHK
jgi:hypothetical protein